MNPKSGIIYCASTNRCALKMWSVNVLVLPPWGSILILHLPLEFYFFIVHPQAPPKVYSRRCSPLLLYHLRLCYSLWALSTRLLGDSHWGWGCDRYVAAVRGAGQFYPAPFVAATGVAADCVWLESGTPSSQPSLSKPKFPAATLALLAFGWVHKRILPTVK